MLEDAQYKYVIADSKLGTIENEKKQEIEDLKEKVCLCMLIGAIM